MANSRDEAFYQRLTRLFRNGPSIRRKARGEDPKAYFDKSIIQNNLGYYGASAFKREASPFSVMGAYGLLDRMSRYCLTGDTLISTNTKEGEIRIDELAKIFENGKPEKKYFTFSYDKKTNTIVLGEIINAFFTKEDEVIEVFLDNDKSFRCTKDHKVMLRDGSYIEAQNLKKNDSLMPFYRKTLEKYKNNNVYRAIYSFEDGWCGEHKIVGEYIRGQKILPEENLHVHHKNYVGVDNEIDNLEVMPAQDHLDLHNQDSKRSSERFAEMWEKKLNDNPSKSLLNFKNKNKTATKVLKNTIPHRLGSENPNFDSSFTIETIKNAWVAGITMDELTTKLGVHNGKFLNRLRAAGYQNYPEFVRDNFDPNYKLDYTSPRLIKDLPQIQDLYDVYKTGISQHKIAELLKENVSTVLTLLRRNGYKTWYQFVKNYKNHKVTKIVSTGIKEKVYDITVDGYHNFALQVGVIVHNSEFSEMEYTAEIACITSETEVATLEGMKSILHLAKQYPNGESFQVWCWDKDSCEIVFGNAHHPRKTGTKAVVKILIDNDEFLECTEDHRIMLVDGTYKQAGMLKSGDALMPFYYKEKDGYMHIRTKTDSYKPAHRYIFENILDVDVAGKHIHHINEIKQDNRTENLIPLTPEEHIKAHGFSDISRRKRGRKIKEHWKDPEYREQHLKPFRDWQASEEGKAFMSQHTSNMNKIRWQTDENYREKMAKIFSEHAKSLWADPVWREQKIKTHSELMKLKYANDPTYAEKTKHVGDTNGRFFQEITTEEILISGQIYNKFAKFVENFDFKEKSSLPMKSKRQFIRRRLQAAGFNTWKEYKKNYKYTNHKVVSVLNEGKVVDVYDLTVDHFENFCLKNGMVISNSGLDIYSDEVISSDENGRSLHIYSDNAEIRKALEELYYEVANIELDGRRWVRNLPVKWNSMIPLLSGEIITIKDLSERIKNGKEEKVYSVQDGTNKIVPGKVIWCDKNYTTNKIVKVWFDDDTFAETAPEHPFVLRNGNQKRADELKENDSLMPFYTNPGKVYDPSTNLFVNESVLSKVTCHQSSYTPQQSIQIGWMKESPSELFSGSNGLLFNFCEIKNSEGTNNSSKYFAGNKNFLTNHSVKKVEILKETCDVYCMTVVGSNGEKDRHNFAICSKDNEGNYTRNGVFVANCKYGDFMLYNEVVPDHGVVAVEPIPVNVIERDEMYDPEDPYAVRFKLLTHGGKVLENWQVTHFRIQGNELFHPYGTSFLEACRRSWRQLCIRSGTYIWTKEHGYTEIENVKPGDTVYSFDYENGKPLETRVKHCIPMGKQKILKVKTAHREIFVTPNHGLLVCDKNGKYYYKKAEEIISLNKNYSKKSYENVDKLILPFIDNKEIKKFVINKNEYSIKLSKKSDYNSENIISLLKNLNLKTSVKNAHAFLNAKKKICYEDFEKLSQIVKFDKNFISVYLRNSLKKSNLIDNNLDFSFTPTQDFMRFFGFMFGDGWIDTNRIYFALGIKENENQFYIDLFKKIFPFSHLIRHSVKKSVFFSESIFCSSKETINLFKTLEFKTGFKNKRIPNWVYSLPKSYKIEFVKGLFDADGCDGSSSIKLSNKGLIEDLQVLCQQIGIPVGNIRNDSEAGIYFDKTFNKNLKRCASYSLFLDLKNTKENHDFLLENVTNIEECEEAETYDLEIDHELHNFVANGVVSHNTMMEDAMLVYRIVRSPERRVFYIDVSGVHPNDIPTFMEAVKETIKGKDIIDRMTGRMDIRYNPVDVNEDYFLPAKPNSQTKIDTLAGGQHVSATEDVEYIRNKLIAGLKIPRAYLTYTEDTGCVTGDTKISLLNGNSIRIDELVDQFNRGVLKEIYCYSTTLDGQVKPGKITKAWETKKVKKLYKIYLDNNQFVECTENHRFLLRNGQYKRADELKANDSLMPIYKKFSSKSNGDLLDGYEMVLDNSTSEWKYTHKIVNEEMAAKNGGHKIQKQRVVHHIDHNKLNNSPENLVEMTWYEHRKLHSENVQTTLLRPDVMAKREPARIAALGSEHHRKQKSEQLTQQMADPNSLMRKWVESDDMKTMVSETMKKAWQDPEYRELKTKQNKEIWTRPEVIKKRSGKNHWNYKEQYNLEWLINYCKENKITQVKHFRTTSGANAAPITQRTLKRIFNENKISGWVDFVTNHLKINHKVLYIEMTEFLDKEVPVYDIEVEEYDNFLVENGIVLHNSKSTLSQQDIRFSHTINHLQKIVIAELSKLGIIHLFAKGFEGEDLLDFELRLSNPSTVAVQQKLQLMTSKLEAAAKAQEMLKESTILSEEYIQMEILGLRMDQISDIRKQRFEGQLRNLELAKLSLPSGEIEQKTITDPFDPSNYKMIGGNAVTPETETSLQTLQNRAEEILSVKLPEPERPSLKVQSPANGKAPVKANPTPNIDAMKRKNARRITFSGKRALSMPDFKSMLDVDNRYAKDPFDTEFLRNPILEFNLTKSTPRILPNLPKDVLSMLHRFDEHHRRNNQYIDIDFITENGEHNIDLIDIERELEKNKK